MPTLDWIGKKAVVNHHRDVPYRLIHCDKDKSYGDPDAGNLLVQGDNLEALKALLPYYAGKVKCIYIDPPYNTGNESWVYNDNVNSPEIRAWLGNVVGKEAEDLSRHDKWLCMMYPRLRLLKEFLREDGSIWISIDDNEVHGLKLILDEIFGRSNFLATVLWQKRTSPDARLSIGAAHDFIISYAACISSVSINRISLSGPQKETFGNFDNDPRGPWVSTDLTGQTGHATSSQYYDIITPHGAVLTPPPGRCWALSKDTFENLNREGRIWFGKHGNSRPRLKRFLNEHEGITAWTWWANAEVGHNQEAKKEANILFGSSDVFDTPKPERLLRKVVELASSKGDLVLDAFAGSGTTGAVASKLGRRHINIEIGAHSATHILPRYKKVIDGEQGGISKEVNWQGGSGFRYCTLGEPLFDADGNVSPAVTFPDLAAHVFFCETGSPIPKRAEPASALIGTFQGRAIYLLHSSEAVGVASERAGNVLTGAVLASLPLPNAGFSGQRVIFAEGCTMPEERLSALGVTFKHIPYQIEGI